MRSGALARAAVGWLAPVYVVGVRLLPAAVAGPSCAAAAGGLVVVADDEQLCVRRVCEADTPNGPHPLETVLSRRTGVPIESVSLCRWDNGPHIVLVARDQEDSVVRTYRLDGSELAPAFADLRIGHPVGKAEIADVDGDSVAELVASISKVTRRDPGIRLRLFVYEWSGVSWVPKWLGSRLGHDLVDFTCVSATGGDRLLTLERTGDGGNVVTVYRWIGFGFRGSPDFGLGFGERIGGGPDVVWVWGRPGLVAWRMAEWCGPGDWALCGFNTPLAVVFMDNGHLYGFDGEAVRPIHRSISGGES